MSGTAATELCRVTVIAPRSRIDLAVPVVAPLADLLPAVLHSAGDGLADEGRDHGGWALQRLGEPPLDTGRTPAALGLRDGDVLYLRPRRDQLPAAAFDDVVDAIATALARRGDRWRPGVARVVALSCGGLLLALGLPVLALAGPGRAVPAAAAGVLTAGLLLAAGAVSRGAGDATAAAVLGVTAVPYAWLAGLFGTALLTTAADGPGGGGFGQVVTASGMPAGAGVALLVAVLAGALVGAARPVFLAAGMLPALGLAGGVVAVAAGPAGGAAVAAVLALALTPMLPMIGYRLAALPAPFVPAGSRDLLADDKEPAGDDTLHRAVLADQALTGLLAGGSGVALAAIGVLARSGGWPSLTLGGLVAVLLVVRSRLFTGRAQRLWLLSCGLLGAAVLGVRLAADLAGPAALVAVLVPAVGLAAAAFGVALRSPDRRRGPLLGRLGDLAELFAALAVIPVTLAVLGVYGYVRALWG